MTTVNSTSGSSSTSASAASSNALMGNYELFLSILTTQVTNQDPLDPMDSSEYTQQLVQYSSVEQSIQTNKYLEEVVATLASTQASSYVNYLGTTVSASGGTAMLTDGNASWNYSLQEDASGTVEIKNASGAVVYSGDVELSAGEGTFEWDGVGDSNAASPDGAYSISFKVYDASDNREAVTTEVSGVVDEVDLSGGMPYLTIGGVKIPVSSVQSVASQA